MKLLFVHQNFPGQFKHLAPALVRAGHKVKALGIGGAELPEVEMIRGEACAAAAARLKTAGFMPDVIVTNPGWGESLFLKDMWPQARIMALIEFFTRRAGWIVISTLSFQRPPWQGMPTFVSRTRIC